MVSLHNVLKNSYKSKPAASINCYKLDKSLSNYNQKIYYNPNELLFMCVLFLILLILKNIE